MKKLPENRVTIYILACIIYAMLTGITRLEAQLPAPDQGGPIALVGGDIYPMNVPVITGGTILFEEGKITAVGRDVSIPEGTEVVDVSGRQVYPGLILSRTTIGLTEIGRHPESTDLAEIGHINPNIRPQVAFHPASEHIGVAAVHGITTAVNMPAGGIITGQATAMMTDGWTWEQMTLQAPVGMVVNWPSGRTAEARAKAMASLKQAIEEARRYKVAREAPAAGRQYTHPIDLRWEAMLPVLRKELPLLVVANEVAQIQAAISWAAAENLDMVLVGGRDAGYLASQLAEKDIAVMVSPVIAGPNRAWEGYDQAYKLPAQLHEAGVRFCIAGEPSAAGAYRLPHHAAAAVAFGLPQEEALKAITIYPAQMLGIDHLVGSLEPGKDATIIVTTGNPLETSTVTEMVFIRGRQLDDTDKHRRLYERYMEKHRQDNP